MDSSNRYNRKNSILGLDMNIKKIIKEELVDVILEKITRNFSKAVEAYQEIQIQQQKLRKKFVSEKDPKKKEKLKTDLIKLHKKVQKAELDFNNALRSEPIEDDLMEKSKGLWANIHAKRKRGEAPAKKGSKAYKKAKKAADNINKSEGKLNENFKKNIIKAKTMKDIKKIYPKAKKTSDVHGAVFYIELEKDLYAKAFSKNTMKSIEPFKVEAIYKMKGKKQTFLWKEGKLNEDVFKAFIDDLKQDPRSKRGYVATATNTENRKTVKARKTDKVWDDGVPVLKYISRASKKDSPLPKGKFKVVVDDGYGWWYYQVGRTWYGIQQKDYGTPPFEY